MCRQLAALALALALFALPAPALAYSTYTLINNGTTTFQNQQLTGAVGTGVYQWCAIVWTYSGSAIVSFAGQKVFQNSSPLFFIQLNATMPGNQGELDLGNGEPGGLMGVTFFVTATQTSSTGTATGIYVVAQCGP